MKLGVRGYADSTMLLAVLCAVIGVLAPSTARAALTPIPVTTCQTITKSGLYVVQNALSNTSGDCVVIAAPNVTLVLNGYALTGGGTGAGIHVERFTKDWQPVIGVFIQGRGPTGFSQISGFANGIRNDADGTGGEFFSVINNTADGLLVNHAWGTNLAPISCTSNGASGVHIVGGGYNALIGPNASNNSSYGVWVQSSSGNTIDGVGGGGNGIAGLYIGCNPAFNGTATKCPGNASSDNNFLYEDGFEGSKFGFVIDLGNTHSAVTNNGGRTNTTDAVDENPTCDANAWYGNIFVTKNQSCIQ